MRKKSKAKRDPFTVLVRDHEQFEKLTDVSRWDATTMLAAVSSDPRSFHELDLAWQRYRRGRSLRELPWKVTDAEQPTAGNWLLIDLACQRLAANDPDILADEPKAFPRKKRKRTASNPVVWCNIPPWWQSGTAIRLHAVLSPLSTWQEPVDFRGILYGRPLADALAERMLRIVETESLPDSYLNFEELPVDQPLTNSQRQTLMQWHQLTVRVHADWLMTPREDLGGEPPRHFLHAGRSWVDYEINNRQQEWIKFRQPPMALDRQTFAYRYGAMGTAEVVTYFSLCRDMIDEGWRLLQASDTDRSQFSSLLYEYGCQRLTEPSTEDDSTPPAEIIETSRRHMPQVSREDDMLDCNCPICRMMAEQPHTFGPTFTFYDGHHLELDGEFAFSLCETLEQWERQQAGFQDDADPDWDDEFKVSDLPSLGEEFSSVWKSSYVADGPLGGLAISTMGLAFRVSELVTDLQTESAGQSTVDRLNRLFDNLRHVESDPSQRSTAAEKLKAYLETLVATHPRMTSKIADFQSQLDTWCRRPLNDVPF